MGKSLKGKELGTGITQRKDGRYQARFTDRRGVRKTLYSNSYREVKSALEKAMLEDQNKVVSTMTLDEWYYIWIREFKSHCRDTSKRTYKIAYDRIRPEIGSVRLCDLNVLTIQLALNRLKTDKSKGDTRAVMIDMLNCAMANDLVPKNYALYTKKASRVPSKEKRVLSKEETNKLLEASRGTPYMYDLIILSLSTGLRIGELIGLCTDDVDLEKGLIYVRRTLVYLPGEECKYAFNDPKTHASARVVPMTETTRDSMIRLLARKEKLNSRFSPEGNFEKLLLVSRTNKPINEANVKKQLRCYGEKLGIEDLTPHVLRHTFATNCIENGMTPRVLQSILGHATLSLTMDLYCHVRKETMRDELARCVMLV